MRKETNARFCEPWFHSIIIIIIVVIIIVTIIIVIIIIITTKRLHIKTKWIFLQLPPC